jgi:hypothetical protein
MIAVSLGVWEPALCILHCLIWAPLAHSAPAASDHGAIMVMPDGTTMPMAAMHGGAPASVHAPAPSSHALCAQAERSHSEHMPIAQPFHELVPAPLFPPMAALMLLGTLAAWLIVQASLRFPPRLRPPIALPR